VKSLFLPSALCLALSLTACATLPKQPTEPLPASLRAPCSALPLPPIPLIDPARSAWEAVIVQMYGECGARHFAAGQASGAP
jgi:hypothetical protein